MSGCYFKKKDLFDCESVVNFLETYGEKFDFKTFLSKFKEIYYSGKLPVVTIPVPDDVVGVVLYSENELKRFIQDRGIPKSVFILDTVDLVRIDGVAEYLR